MNDIYTIKSKKELSDFIESDKKACFGTAKINTEKALRNPFKYNLYKFFRLLRKYEYLCYKRDTCRNSFISKIFSVQIKLCDIRKNRLSLKIGVEITPFRCGKNVRICHPNVIINGYVGEGCILHGNNVIGNKKTGEKNSVPRTGNNVDIGTGATIIGDLVIADNCIIGAGSVVTKSFTVPGTVIAGVPAQEIGDKK